MALSFIGKPISLISHSDVRYRGILAGIDPAASTIQLSNVYSMGTESRRPPAEFIPPVQEPYQYIIFRASEVKDLAVDEPTPRRSVHDDPAVLGASAPSAVNGTPYGQYGAPSYPQGPAQPGTQAPLPQQPGTFPTQAPPPHGAQVEPAASTAGPISAAAGPSERATSSASSGTNRRSNSVHTAAASLETVERALGDLRVSNGTHGSGRGGRRGHGGGHGHGHDAKTAEIKVPTTDFDFQGSNARFDKAALAPKKSPRVKEESDDEQTNPSDNEGRKDKAKEKEKEKSAYNPQKSFFDQLSSSSHGIPSGPGAGRGGGGPRRGGGGRNRREEERERNVATFGEPGGVGLMGPGAYVGGWGGYGRRGGRPRRGASVVGGR